MDKSHTLAVTSLSAFYGNVQVLSSVSLLVHSGEVVCLTGPNGSGKSTLLTVMAGIAVEPLRYSCSDATGLPSFDDKNIRTFRRKEAASHIAFMCQNEMSTWNYPVFDIVLTGRFPHTPPDGMYRVRDYEIASAIMEQLGIGNLTDRLVRSLSGGEFQKVRIARALAQKPDFLLLDEPAANLDFGYQHKLMETVCSIAHCSGIGVLATIHDLNLAARFGDRIALLPKLGRCEVGTPRELFNSEKLEAAYGTRFGIYDHPVYRCPQVYAL